MFRTPALICLVFLGLTSNSFAGVILPPLKFPDIAGFNLKGDLGDDGSGNDLAFDSASQTLALSGAATSFTPRQLVMGSEFPIMIDDGGTNPGSFKFSGVLGASTGEANTRELSGSLEITGRLRDFNLPSVFGNLSTSGVETLLRGTLRGVTSIFNPTAGRAEFNVYFDVDPTSHLASFYGPTGLTQIVAYTNAADYDNDFFVNMNPSNTADTTPTIPEPSSFLSWAVLTLGMAIGRSRYRRPDVTS